MKKINTLNRKFTLLIITLTIGFSTYAQDIKLESYELNKLKSQLDAGSFLLGYGLNNGSSIEAGYNFFLGFNSGSDLGWNKVSLKAGYSPSFANDLYSLSAGFAHTRNLIAFRADLTTSFSGGDTNMSIHPKIGVDLLIMEFYIGYNQYFKRNIQGLENQVTFTTNINLAWNFLMKRSVKQAIKSL